MTVKELLDAGLFCDLAEIIIRKNGHGQWVQGIRIGSRAKVYPSEITAELIEARQLDEFARRNQITLKEGEIVDTNVLGIARQLPMKVICKDCRKALPEEIGKLTVAYFQPRHIPSFHKEQLTHNDFELHIDCYPPEKAPMIEVREVTKEIQEIPGQMNIMDYLEEEANETE